VLVVICACACARSGLSVGGESAPGDDEPDPDPIVPKRCEPGPLCTPFVNDPETGECIQVIARDGTRCDARCLLDATCVSGACVGGTPVSCDDRNACTADECDAELGCIHGVVECPGVSGPCEEATCSPGLGCTRRFLSSGEPCGPGLCTQHVCRAGTCGPEVGPSPELVGAWYFDEPSGPDVLDSSGSGHSGVLVAGTRVSTPDGGGIANTGDGLLIDIPDHPDFAFSGSFSVQTWIQTPVEPVMGQQVIVFRGDAREGLDPFVLSLQPDGVAQFVVMGPEDGSSVAPRAQVPAGTMIELTGVFNAKTREARLYVQCALAATECSPFDQPMRELDPNSSPGVGLGSHARRESVLYQFRGVLDGVRLYSGALDAEAIAFNCRL
jgi:hypothetical protein